MARRVSPELARSVVAGVVIAVLASACADAPSLDAESLVDGLPAAVVPDAPEVVTDVECPEPEEGAIAQTMICTAAIHGQAVTVDLVIDGEGAVAASMREELLDLSEVAAAASARLEADLATPVEVRCPGTVVVNTPGLEVICGGTSGGRERELIVEIVNADGGWSVDFLVSSE